MTDSNHQWIPGGVATWADDLDDGTQQQALDVAAMPFVERPVALMADAHLGYGCAVGAVIATKGAVIPSAVGVDIGCGMIAQPLALTRDDLTEPGLMQELIADAVPAGNGPWGNRHTDHTFDLPAELKALTDYRPEHTTAKKVITQFGTLGGGNHFVEICADETDRLWVVLHSGSRNPGKTIADHYIEQAKGLMRSYFIDLPNPDLAYLVQGTDEFTNYIRDMQWAQEFAHYNRSEMLANVIDAIGYYVHRVDPGRPASPHDLVAGSPVNCHHNYTKMENHGGRNLWVTRKGAIQARTGTRGVIPGSMATGSFIVEGLGNPRSWMSASHGAGRRMSRTAARKNLTPDSLQEAMAGIAWNQQPDKLLDEHPDAYKDIGEVMEAQDDLVRVLHRLTTLVNYQGT